MREGWTLTPLGHVARQVIEPIDLRPDVDYRNLGVKWYAGGTFLRDAKPGREIRASRLFRVRPGQFVYNRLFATEGSFALIGPDDAEAVASNEFPVFDVDAARLLPEYLYLHFQQESVWQEVNRQCTGTTKSRLRWKEERFRAFTLALPPLSAQRRIVDLIGALDAPIARAEALGGHAESLWWRVAAHIEESTSSRPTKPLSEIADISGGLTKNAKDAERADAVEVPYLRVANVLRRRLDLTDVATISASRGKVDSSQLLPGDVLMSEGGDRDKLGRGAVWRGQIPGCTHQNHVFRARLTNEDFTPDFVSAWANSFGQRWFETHGTQTTGIASINKSTLSKFPVPDIPLEEQVRWADLLQALTDQEDEYRAQAQRLRGLRASVLSVLLSGEHEIPHSYDELMEVAS